MVLRRGPTYFFRVWAANAVGDGKSVTVMADTDFDAQEVREAERERRRKEEMGVAAAAEETSIWK